MKISFANVIAEICENIPGGDAEAVCKAIGSDTRVGNKYFRGGLAYGGPCFCRDNRAFNVAAKRAGKKAPMAIATDEVNTHQKGSRLTKFVGDIIEEKKCKKISILGLAYKEDTSLVEEAPSISLIWELCDMGVKVSAYDPMAMEEAKRSLMSGSKVRFCKTVEACLKGSSVCVILTPWKEFIKLDRHDFLENMKKNPTVIDCWGIYKSDKMRGIDLIRMGKSRIHA